MRIFGGLTLLAACLFLTGCSLFGKKSGTPSAAQQQPPDPPPALPPARESPNADSFSTTSQTNGVLIGQVLDRYNRRPGNVWIRVVDLEDTREPKAAPIEKQSDEQGYFSIVGLRPPRRPLSTTRPRPGRRPRVRGHGLVATRRRTPANDDLGEVKKPQAQSRPAARSSSPPIPASRTAPAARQLHSIRPSGRACPPR